MIRPLVAVGVFAAAVLAVYGVVVAVGGAWILGLLWVLPGVVLGGLVVLAAV